MKRIELLKFASMGVSVRIDKEQKVIEALQADGKEAPLATKRVKQFESDFDEIQRMINKELLKG